MPNVSHIMGSYSKFAQEPAQVLGAKSLHRAIGILLAFTDDRPRRTLSSLSAELDLKKSTTHRIVSALEQEGFLSRSHRGLEYQLGPELIVLGRRALKAIDFREAAQGELEALAEATGEDVTLEALVGWEVLILHEEQGRSLLGIGSSVGTLWPAHATSTGKVLLAYADETAEVPPGGLVALTDHTIVSWEEWTATLEQVRKDGFATSLEELEYGYVAVGAPVRDGDGRTVAAISIGGPIHRIGKERIPEIVDLLCPAALRISERLGFRSESNRP